MKKILSLIFISMILTLNAGISAYAQPDEEKITLASYLNPLGSLGLDSPKQVVYMYRQGNEPDMKILDYAKFKDISEKISLESDNRYTSPNLSDGWIIKVIDIETESEQAIYLGKENEVRACYFLIAPYTITAFELSYDNNYALSNPEDKELLASLWDDGIVFDRKTAESVYEGAYILGEDEPTRFSSKSLFGEGEKALNTGMVPRYIGRNFASHITREEFCDAAYNFLVSVTKLPTSPAINVFFDTDNERVNVLNLIGIIKGRGSNEFAPLSYISREEAAVILHRIAVYMNFDTTIQSEFKYDDDERISEWAKMSVYACFEKNIMHGVGNNEFDPTSAYARDQAFATLMRLAELNAEN